MKAYKIEARHDFVPEGGYGDKRLRVLQSKVFIIDLGDHERELRGWEGPGYTADANDYAEDLAGFLGCEWEEVHFHQKTETIITWERQS